MGDATRLSVPVIETGHSFARATVVRFDGINWVRGLAGQMGLRVVGSVSSPDAFEAVQAGELNGLTGLELTPGTQYYAHPTIPGAFTNAPNVSPVFQAYTADVAHVAVSSGSAISTSSSSSADVAAAIATAVATQHAADVALFSPLSHDHDSRYLQLESAGTVWSLVDGTPVMILIGGHLEQVRMA